MFDDEMSKEMREKVTKRLVGLGIAEDEIDDHLIWVTKKATRKIMKLNWVLKKKGVDEAKIKEMLADIVDRANDPEMIKKWQEKREKWCKEHCHFEEE